MEVTVKDHQKKILLNPAQIKKIVRTILRHEEVKSASVTIVFVNSQKIRALNKKYLNRDYSTDVLAFDADDGEGKSLSGDVVISTDAAIQNALKFENELGLEVILYVIHGILHLLGYDDRTSSKRNKMQRKENELLNILNSMKEKILR